MVNGFTKFKERFQGFENQYVIIGGTACDLIMENEELPFRAQKMQILEDDAVLTPLPIDDEISSLSAILLNEAYYELLKTGQMMVDGIPVLSPTCLIPFKAKAWLDLKERKLNGEQVDSKNIKKHKNDVFRLAQLITANTRQVLSSEIAEDMKKFLSEIADETVDLKSLGIRGTDKQKIIDMLYLCYNLNDNT